MSSPATITVLRHGSAVLTKTWTTGATNKPVCRPYGQAKQFSCQEIELAGFEDLCGLLDTLATEPSMMVIRGALVSGRDPSQVLRRKKASGPEEGYFKEVPRSWAMLDVDLTGDEDLPYSTHDECVAAVKLALRQLPKEIQDAGCFWQLSSSAGFKPGLRIHLWVWLDRPLGEKQLTLWAEYVNDAAGKQIVDAAVFRTVQPIYTANPLFDNTIDPVAVRCGIIPGPAAVLPRVEGQRHDWRKKLDRLTPGNTHATIRDTCASYFTGIGADAPEAPLVTALLAATQALESPSYEAWTAEDAAPYIASAREFAKSKVGLQDHLIADKDGTPKACLGNVLMLLQSAPEWEGLVGFDVRYERLTLLREPMWRGAPTPREWTDNDTSAAVLWMTKDKRMAAKDDHMFKAVVALAGDNFFDPVADYLNGLVWDGTERLSEWLHDWCQVAPIAGYTDRVARMFPISCVARALAASSSGVKVDTMPVFFGATGDFKSSLLNIMGKDKWYAEVDDEKDFFQKITGPWIVEAAELSLFHKLDEGRIKAIINPKVDRNRTPYARLPKDRPRRCVLAGTTNRARWQKDPTSARRFWPVSVGRINLKLAERDVDQLWAEAVVAYRAGEVWYVDARDEVFLTAQGKVFQKDTWEEQITKVLDEGHEAWAGNRQVHIVKNCKRVTASEIMLCVFGDTKQSKHDQQRVVDVMARLGWEDDGSGGWLRP